MRGDARKRTPEPTAASSIDAEQRVTPKQRDRWRIEYENPLHGARAKEAIRILVLLGALDDADDALRDEQQAREKAHNRAIANGADRVRAEAENAALRATLAAVRAWAANPHGAKSELYKILGDES